MTEYRAGPSDELVKAVAKELVVERGGIKYPKENDVATYAMVQLPTSAIHGVHGTVSTRTCMSCGALVWDIAVHDHWHDTQGE